MDLLEHCRVIGRTDQVDNDTWLSLRKIGASDIAAIYETSKYQSRFSLWAVLTKRQDRRPETNATTWGHRLERVIAEAYAEEYGVAVYWWPVILQSTKFDFMTCTPDFFIVVDPLGVGCVTDWLEDTPPANIVALLECKSGGITSRGSTWEWNSDQVPFNYELQGMGQASVTGIPRVTYAALLANEGLQVRYRTYDETDLQELEEKEFLFWEYVETDLPPEPDGSPPTFAALKAMYPNSVEGKSIELTADELEIYRAWHEAKELSDLTGDAAKKLYAKLALIVGEAEELRWHGKTLITYKKSKDGVKVDVDAMLDAHPDLREQYEVQKPGHRTMLDKAKNELVE
jgi:predicted phage-related endonuclease